MLETKENMRMFRSKNLTDALLIVFKFEALSNQAKFGAFEENQS